MKNAHSKETDECASENEAQNELRVEVKNLKAVKKYDSQWTIRETARVDALKLKYRRVYMISGVTFWAILFFMANFMFFYLSFMKYRLNQAQWFVPSSMIVLALTVFYLVHVWYGWLSNNVLAPEQYAELEEMNEKIYGKNKTK
eukprot:CAMPEP_0197515892 /NCGR_PEP_ID=MMETSP1318-20131121/864_1 /TAXON_ID=552666 /ORGANISM="Partenskyella glossopodia, Strain RCC365" /LENGTH=143 /DNA_ID=CAMNT_0043064367 /DNA_START=186 /DNA_END=617 /DNA_ORIENTATION=-